MIHHACQLFYDNLFFRVWQTQREFLLVARAREGWGKGNIISGGAFCFTKYVQSAEKKASPSEGEAEGGCGGNSASPEPKRGAKPRARRIIQYGGVCWTMSELSLNKIQTPTEAKLFRNFAYGSRAKISGDSNSLNPSNFCPLAKIFCAAFYKSSERLTIYLLYYYNGLLMFLSFGFVT